MDDVFTWMEARHSVREYRQEPLRAGDRQKLLAFLDGLRAESGLDIRLEEGVGKVFSSPLMKMVGWKHLPPAYFAFVGERGPEAEEKCGYFGEKLVLFAQSIGLNTCWVGLFKKNAAVEGTLITIALGYGEDAGKPRKSKTAQQVSRFEGEAPEWFARGVRAALLAPTAVNRQGFTLEGAGDRVTLSCANGSFTAVDRGIVKYHFEQGAGAENFRWTEP